ncbi:MAG: metallophosphoesterase family protein [Bacteroidales bacterium]|nr:metallophosphoesterase family protein [Bacteroidales bacterium]
MKKIGIISDTHSHWDDKYVKYFSDCDEIWHAGDFGSQDIADGLARIRPLRGVCGNCDGYPVRYQFGPTLYFEVEQVGVLLTHIGGYPGHYDPRILAAMNQYRPRLFVCGHSHIARVMYDRQRQMLCVNPGAAGIQGFHQVRTLMRLELHQGDISHLEVVELGPRV